MGAIPSSSINRHSVGSDFNPIKSAHSDETLGATFNFHGHTVKLDEKDVKDLQFFLSFKSVIESKRALQQKFISAAPAEAKLQHQLDQLMGADRSKLSPEDRQKLDKNIALAENTLKEIQVDTVLGKISQKPQSREAIIKEFDHSVEKVVAVSSTLTQAIAHLLTAGLIQPQQSSLTDSSSRNSLAPSSGKIEAKGVENKELEKTAAQRTQQAAQQVQSLRTANKEEKESKSIEKLGQQFAENRKKEVS